MGTFVFNERIYKIGSSIVSFYNRSLLISGTGKSIYLNLDLFNIVPKNSIDQLLGTHKLSKTQLLYSKVEVISNNYLLEDLVINISTIESNSYKIIGEGKLFEEYDDDLRLGFSFELIVAKINWTI